VAYVTIFSVVKLLPTMLSVLGAPATYGSFSAVCFVLAVFSHLAVPDCDGKTLQQVEAMFQKEKEEER
jgi:hypothetical protein